MRKLLLPALLALFILTAGAQEPAPADVPNPVLISAAAPTYPRSHFNNPDRTVLVGLTVDTDGIPRNVHVVHSGGDRFDKNAVETVARYKFKPALKAGQPVACDMQVEVNYKAK